MIEISFKIVRDRHQEIFGHHPWDWRISPHPAMALLKKVFEEAGELVETMDPEELYDLLDVANELARVLDSTGYYHKLHRLKVSRMGGFSSHLEWCPLKRDNPENVDYSTVVAEPDCTE